MEHITYATRQSVEAALGDEIHALEHENRMALQQVANLKAENAELAQSLSMVVCAILTRNGRSITDMTARDRLAELHAKEQENAELKEYVHQLHEVGDAAAMVVRDRTNGAISDNWERIKALAPSSVRKPGR